MTSKFYIINRRTTHRLYQVQTCYSFLTVKKNVFIFLFLMHMVDEVFPLSKFILVLGKARNFPELTLTNYLVPSHSQYQERWSPHPEVVFAAISLTLLRSPLFASDHRTVGRLLYRYLNRNPNKLKDFF